MLNKITNYALRFMSSKTNLSYLAPSSKTFTFLPPSFENVNIEEGYGAQIRTTTGLQLIDCMSQNLCISIGYRHPLVEDAISKQRAKISHITTMYNSSVREKAAKDLIRTITLDGSGIVKKHDYTVHFTSSGSEAVDLALQMASFLKPGKMLSLTNAYHGVHGEACSATHVPSMHSFPLLYAEHQHIIPHRSILDNTIDKSISSLIVEPIQGYGGVFPLENGFMLDAFSRVMQNDGITICDEIQTGFGRTGQSFWAFQHHIPFESAKFYPDIITFAKGAGNGEPISGIIVKRNISERFCTKKTFNTFAAHSTSCVAMSAVIKTIRQENLIGRVKLMGAIFRNRMEDLIKTSNKVFKDVRGEGFLQGIEVNGDMNLAVEIQIQLLKKGVLMGRGGVQGNVLRFQPPMILTVDELLHILEALKDISNKHQ